MDILDRCLFISHGFVATLNTICRTNNKCLNLQWVIEHLIEKYSEEM